MKVRVIADFTGYPDGTDASRRLFRAGEEVEVSEDFAALLRRKGHAEDLPAEAGDSQGDQPCSSPIS